VSDYDEGEVFEINWRVHGHANAALIAYYHQRIDVFLHRWEDTGEWCLLADQSWLDEHEDGDGSESAEYVRAYVEGVSVDPDDVFAHPRIDPVEE